MEDPGLCSLDRRGLEWRGPRSLAEEAPARGAQIQSLIWAVPLSFRELYTYRCAFLPPLGIIDAWWDSIVRLA